ncbi:RhuM family protein [Sulfurospirillum sp. hDNRA2]|uniref:RhuM family protein n=1 Tax=Sulfurospirillum sp. hDNRA2 TaxID=3237298 RepID=UPI0020B8E6A4|nr:RhuM family protein [Sulfurospirillum sp. DNRA8]MCP3650947.1 virulence RhuM family protein [Sulfurospirillum sp. DNRA8]MCR1809793.1 virulence RhuM family protein [Sulfurospirillum sp. DNRA8]
MENQNVVLYTDDLGHVNLEVSLENETVWLSQKQLCELFDRDKSVISRHIKNIYKEGELEENSVVAKNATTASDGKTYVVEFYNLDMIVSLGYRVNSKRATEFRKWATNVLKQYLIKGYALNHHRINAQSLSELTATMELVRKSIETQELSSNEAKGLLDIINNYAKTWALLQGYDADALHALQGTLHQRFILDYDEARSAIKALKKDLMAKGDATELFGNEKASEFQSALLNIYQTFGGVDLLPSIEEKAANLLYYVIKDHAFSDGNKRIGSFLFILFLHKNGIAYKPNGEPKINDNALVSLALLVAASEPSQKELMVKLIVNLLGETD